MRTPIVIGLGLVLACGHAAAHDLWLEREGEVYALHRGHRHSPHEGEPRIDYDPSIVQRVDCFDGDGSPVPLRIAPEYPVRVPDACAAVVVLTSSGYWTKTPFGTENEPRAHVEQAIRSWLSFEGVKRINAWHERFRRPLTGDLEIVPEEDPTSRRPGDKLKLWVSLSGEPVGGAVVAVDGRPRGRTEADGRLNVRLRRAGLQMIQASLTLPDTTGAADEVIRTTMLNFEILEEK
jgi:nickel transport protein